MPQPVLVRRPRNRTIQELRIRAQEFLPRMTKSLRIYYGDSPYLYTEIGQQLVEEMTAKHEERWSRWRTGRRGNSAIAYPVVRPKER